MTGVNATWRELNDEWPWSRVTRAHDTIVTNRYHAAFPTAFLHSTFIAANLPKGRRGPKPHDLMLPGSVPAALRQADAVAAPYSASIIDAFTLARRLGMTGNAHLAAFGTNELRASGWMRGES